MAKKDTELITLDWYKRAQKIRSYQLSCDFQVFVRYMSELRFLLGSDRLQYPIDGSNLVEQVKYNETQQQIWINDQQYFSNIPNHIWNFHIGGYQVCQKWLKDCKGRELSFNDLVHYQNIISILGETIEIMSDIDQIITKHGGFPFS
jgi:hypothetical protein